MSAKVVTVASTKGGVGKSTIAHNFVVGCAKRGMKVLLVDADPQGTSSALAASRPEPDYASVSMTQGRIFESIEKFKSAFDLILIDVGGQDGGLLRSAVIAAGLAKEDGLLLVPVLTGQIDIFGASLMMKVVKEAEGITPVRARFVLNMKNPNALVNLTYESIDALSEWTESVPLLENELCYRNDYKKTDDGKAVLEVSPHSKAANEFDFLIDEVLQLIGLADIDQSIEG